MMFYACPSCCTTKPTNFCNLTESLQIQLPICKIKNQFITVKFFVTSIDNNRRRLICSVRHLYLKIINALVRQKNNKPNYLGPSPTEAGVLGRKLRLNETGFA